MREKGKSKIISCALAFIFVLEIMLNFIVVQAAQKQSIVPDVDYVKAPTLEYSAGDTVTFELHAPNYGGRVQYRVILWDDNKKEGRDLWEKGDRYYTNWMPYGNNNFNLHWRIDEPGSYRITVYVKRAGIENNKTYLKEQNCDSYMESQAFVVKAKNTAFDKDGQIYGSKDENKFEAYNRDINITAKNVTFNNARLEGNLTITGNNAVIKNVNTAGSIIIDPGKDGSCTLENVTAKSIEVLSGGQNSIHIKNSKSDSMNVNSKNPVRIEVDGNTEIVATRASGYVIFDKKSGTFGIITITKDENGQSVVEFRGNIQDTIKVEAAAAIRTGQNSSIANLVINTKSNTDIVKLEGQYQKVEINSIVKLEAAANTKIENVIANKAAEIKLDKTASITNIDKRGNEVSIIGENNTGSNTPPVNNGGGGGYIPPPQPSPTVSVGAQIGTIYAAEDGQSATYAVTTSRIADGQAITITGCAADGKVIGPNMVGPGLTVTGSNILKNASTISVAASHPLPGKFYFKVMINGITSNLVTITVNPPLLVPAAPVVTANDSLNLITGIDNTMEFKVDAGEYIKYNGTNAPSLAGIHTVLVRVSAVPGISHASATTTLNFTFSNPVPPKLPVTADDDANVIIGIDNTMEFNVDGAGYVKYNGTNAPDLTGEHTVLIRVAENLPADTPAGAPASLTFTMNTPAAPAVTADDMANLITGIDNTMEFKVDAGEYIKYNGTNAPGLAGIHTVLVRVAAVPGISYASAPATLNFTFSNLAPPAPPVTADDDANVILGIDNTMEFNVDGAGYVKYNGTNAPDLKGEHIVLVRISEVLPLDTPAGSAASLTFTMNTPAAPAVTANDIANLITGIDSTMEFKVDAGEYIKYDGTNAPNLAGIHTVLVRVVAVPGISYASAPATLNFTFSNPEPSAPLVTADDDANVIIGIDNTMEFNVDGAGYVKYNGTNSPDLTGEHTVLVRFAENLATDTPAGSSTSLIFTRVASVSSVTALNGSVTIILDGKPTAAPLAGDFTATISIDGGAASPLTLAGFNYDGNVTVTYTFPAVDSTASVQSVVVKVKLAGNETAANAFIVAPLTPQQIALNTVNAARGNNNCNIPIGTLNTATGNTNAISANLAFYKSYIGSASSPYTAETLLKMIDYVNMVRAQVALRALGSTGLTCADPIASPSVTFLKPAALTDGSGIILRVTYSPGSINNVIASNSNGNVVITRHASLAGSIDVVIDIMGILGIGVSTHYLVTVPAGTDTVTWVLQ